MLEQVASIFSEVGLTANIEGNNIIVKRRDGTQSLMNFFFFLFPEAVDKISNKLQISLKSENSNDFKFSLFLENIQIGSVQCFQN